MPDPSQPSPHQFFWQEYLARDAEQALAFYKRLAGYESVLLESRLDIDYHVLRSTRGRAGLFRLPPQIAGVQPNWLPYVLVNDPAAFATRVPRRSAAASLSRPRPSGGTVRSWSSPIPAARCWRCRNIRSESAAP